MRSGLLVLRYYLPEARLVQVAGCTRQVGQAVAWFGTFSALLLVRGCCRYRRPCRAALRPEGEGGEPRRTCAALGCLP